jgi:hypothetical protein
MWLVDHRIEQVRIISEIPSFFMTTKSKASDINQPGKKKTEN